MTDLEINVELAKAMGWEKDQTCEINDHLYVAEWIKKETRGSILRFIPINHLPWRRFDYSDPVIFVAICKWWKLDVIHGFNRVYEGFTTKAHSANSIEKAAALCVIDAVKRGAK